MNVKILFWRSVPMDVSIGECRRDMETNLIPE